MSHLLRVVTYNLASEFDRWQDARLNEGATTIVKMLFKRHDYLNTEPSCQAAANNDYVVARDIKLRRELHDGHEAFLRRQRGITDTSGYRYYRFYGMRDENGPLMSPTVYDGPWRTFLITFTHLNGPLGGEKTYAVAPSLNREIGLTELPDEMHVALRIDGSCSGAATVTYNDAGTMVNRTFYSPLHSAAQQGGDIARRLIEETVTETRVHRLPLVLPPAHVMEKFKMGLCPSVERVRQHLTPAESITSFTQLIPARLLR